MHDRDARQSLSDGPAITDLWHVSCDSSTHKRHVLTVSIDSARFTGASCEPL